MNPLRYELKGVCNTQLSAKRLRKDMMDKGQKKDGGDSKCWLDCQMHQSTLSVAHKRVSVAMEGKS
jgi:hypothetical protein